MNNEITIPIEAKIKYIERRKKDFEACQAAIANQDYKFIQKVGHDLKGNGITFGFEPLSILGEKLENSAATKDVNTLKTLLKSYGDFIKTMKA